MGDWIKSKGVSGERGYLNIKTGEFRTTIPQSVQEKEQERLNRNKAVLTTYSANKARFNETGANSRNYSSETRKKRINVPVIFSDNKGNFDTSHLITLAPGADSVGGVDPLALLYVEGTALGPILKGVGRGLEFGLGRVGDPWARNRIISRELLSLINKTQLPNFTPGLVKFYGPTMGKTTAALTNKSLVDFDDIVRSDILLLAQKLGKGVRQLKTESPPEYVKLLEDAILKWKSNPANSVKTLVVSNAALAKKGIFDNVPQIPSRSVFVKRQAARSTENKPIQELTREAELYYDDLMSKWYEDPLINDRFVSDIERTTPLLYLALPTTAIDRLTISNTYIGSGNRILKGPSFNGYIENPNSWYLGEYLGGGAESMVYNHALDPNKVIKISLEFSNPKIISEPLFNFIELRNLIPYLLEQTPIGTFVINNRKYLVTTLDKTSPLPNNTKMDLIVQELIPKMKKQGFDYIDGYFTNGKYRIGDLKPENIGRDANGNLKFFDVQSW